MKRNWDIVREVLIATENLDPGKVLRSSDFDSSQIHEIEYHVILLNEAGLLDARISPRTSSPLRPFIINSLSWEGHEFLDAIRENSTWEKTKSIILKKGVSFTFDIIKSVSSSLAKNALDL